MLPPDPEPGWLADVPSGLHRHFSRAIGQQTRPVADRVCRALRLAGPGRAGPGRADDAYLDALQSTGYQLSDEGSARRFDGNVTIVAGRRDRITGHLDQFDALSRYGHGSFVALSDAGHYLPFEQPERFRSITLDWLAAS